MSANCCGAGTAFEGCQRTTSVGFGPYRDQCRHVPCRDRGRRACRIASPSGGRPGLPGQRSHGISLAVICAALRVRAWAAFAKGVSLHLQKRGGGLQISRFEALREFIVNFPQRVEGFITATLALPDTSQVTRRAQFPRSRLLGSCEGLSFAQVFFYGARQL
jgi:hypothetical protein